MSDFPVYDVNSTPEGSKQTLEEAKEKFRRIPNLYGVMAQAPALVKAYAALTEIFSESSLDPIEQQVVLMTNNRLNGCDYCMAAHTTIMQMLKADPPVIKALREDTVIPDPKLQALSTFAAAVNTTRGRPSDDDVAAFLSAGYTHQTILEVIVGTAYKVLSNYTNHIAHTPLDEVFAKNKWP